MVLQMLLLLVLGAAFVGFLALFWLTPLGVPTLKRLGGGQVSPDLSFGYRADDVYRLLARYGAAGIAHWRRLLLLDMVFPGVYAALFALLAAEWAQWVGAEPSWRIAAIACPILAGASDYIENLLLLAMLRALPRKAPALVAAASLFTRAKFIFSHATLAVPLLYWGAMWLGWLT
jgi:hypothetical protein